MSQLKEKPKSEMEIRNEMVRNITAAQPRIESGLRSLGYEAPEINEMLRVVKYNIVHPGREIALDLEKYNKIRSEDYPKFVKTLADYSQNTSQPLSFFGMRGPEKEIAYAETRRPPEKVQTQDYAVDLGNKEYLVALAKELTREGGQYGVPNRVLELREMVQINPSMIVSITCEGRPVSREEFLRAISDNMKTMMNTGEALINIRKI